MLPDALVAGLRAHLVRVRGLWERDREAGQEGVFMPQALEKKYPNGDKSWPWFWVFPSRSLSVDSRTELERRHYAHEQALQRAIKQAVANAGIAKPATISAPFRSCSAIPMFPPQ